MRLHYFWLCQLLPLAAAQLPFNIFNIPPSIRDPLIKMYLESAKVDTQCFRDIRTWFKDLILAGLTAQKCKSFDCLRDEKITDASYALKILASTGHPHSLDLDELSLTLAGDPHLCKSIEGPYPTKYCFLHVHLDWEAIDLESHGISLAHLPGGKIPDIEDREGIVDRCSTMAVSNVRIAFCMPASCERDTNIRRILSNITNGTAELCEISCVGPKNEPNSFFYLFNAVLATLIVIAIAASLFDYFVEEKVKKMEKEGTTGWKLLMSFSIPRNTLDLFSIRMESDFVLCLHAIRFISFTWVANAHADIFAADGDNGLQFFRESDYFFSDVFLNSYASVDTFFLISGLLVAYKFFRKAHKNPEYAYSLYEWTMYYVHRWLRLTPAYLLFIALFVAWTPQMHGIWATSTAQNATLYVKNCENYWWLNALYLNNFGHIADMCYPISWFLCVDTQLYWIAPLFLFAIFYSWRTGLASVIGGLLFGVGATIFLTAYYDLPAMGFTVKDLTSLDYITKLYMKPWTRFIPYLAGILCGYFIVLVREKIIKIRQPKHWEIAACWLISTACAFAVIFSVYDYIRGESEWNVAVRSLYGIFARVGWSAAVGWVVLACTFDWAGPVKALLEHPLWYPLGRLSYCAFLSHWFMIHVLLDGGDRPSHFVSLWHTYLTITVPVVFLSYIMAYFWSCLVEIPFMKIEVIVVDLLTRRSRVQESNELPKGAWSNSITNGMASAITPEVTKIEVNQ